MKKLPHEKLREAAKTEANIHNYYPCVVAAKDFGAMDDTRYTTEVKMLNAIADEIEKYYIPRPRFEDGEPVQDSDLIEIGECAVCCVYMDGSWLFNPDKYEDERNPKPWDEQEGRQCDFIKRPEPKVLDAEGVEIKVGDVVWPINNPEMKMVVDNFQRIYGQDMTANCEFEGEYYNFDVDKLTHREPDSLEKLRDDIQSHVTSGWHISTSQAAIYANRLTTIMERDA